MTIGLCREPRPRPNAGDTYMTRARLRNERGLDDGPRREGSTSPPRVGPASALRDVGIPFPAAARGIGDPRGPRPAGLAGPRRGVRFGDLVHWPVRGGGGRGRLDGRPAGADRSGPREAVLAVDRG